MTDLRLREKLIFLIPSRKRKIQISRKFLYHLNILTSRLSVYVCFYTVLSIICLFMTFMIYLFKHPKFILKNGFDSNSNLQYAIDSNILDEFLGVTLFFRHVCHFLSDSKVYYKLIMRI